MQVLRPDIVVESPVTGTVAVVEIKNPRAFTAELAADFRYQLREYGLHTQAPYFLIVSQDQGYLWKEENPENRQTLPTWQFPMQQVIEYYLPNLNPADRLRETELELIIRQWLIDLANDQQYPAEIKEALNESEFLEQIKGSLIVAEPRWSLFT